MDELDTPTAIAEDIVYNGVQIISCALDTIEQKPEKTAEMLKIIRRENERLAQRIRDQLIPLLK